MRTSRCFRRALCDQQQWRFFLSETVTSSVLPAAESVRRRELPEGPDLNHFLRRERSQTLASSQRSDPLASPVSSKSVYIETYGCQMNVSDTEVVLSILQSNGYSQTNDASAADLVLLNTCAIREKPENKIWTRLKQLRREQQRKNVIGVLGCMAERLKDKLLDTEKLADLVVGPDAYRDLPNLLHTLAEMSEEGSGAVNVALSLEETYADIMPLRQSGRVSAFLSIMRGCNNMCSFCIVPYTRGRERSRPMASILDEVKYLRDRGVKEITLLGQNVNSYADLSTVSVQSGASQYDLLSLVLFGCAGRRSPFSVYAPGFRSFYKPRRQGATTFAQLLDAVADVDPEIRIRFTSPHPKDFSHDVIDVKLVNCRTSFELHVPAQSGSSAVLERMKRGYDREAYDTLIAKIRQEIEGVALSTDIIVGFSGETEEEVEDTVDLLKSVRYEQGFLFKYSEREKTFAHRHLPDDVPEEAKQRRLERVIDVYREQLFLKNQQEIGQTHLVLVEGEAKKAVGHLTGRTDTFKRVIFPRTNLRHAHSVSSTDVVLPSVGDYVAVRVDSVTHGTLHATPLEVTTLQKYPWHKNIKP